MSARGETLNEATDRLVDLYAAAAREAQMLRATGILINPPARCPGCGVSAHSVWFRSRGWVCCWCEGERDG